MGKGGGREEEGGMEKGGGREEEGGMEKGGGREEEGGMEKGGGREGGGRGSNTAFMVFLWMRLRLHQCCSVLSLSFPRYWNLLFCLNHS